MTVVDLTLKKEKDEKEFQRRLKIIEVNRSKLNSPHKSTRTTFLRSRRDVKKKKKKTFLSSGFRVVGVLG